VLERFKFVLEHCNRAGRAPYLVVEKILAADEDLRTSLPVQGTRGYVFPNRLNGLLDVYRKV
jgi:(1->4)-alpha-D-glucan 1-alpha-D-glucosylmutase